MLAIVAMSVLVSLVTHPVMEGNTRMHSDTSGRLRIDVSYDPRDPGTVVRADGEGRWGRTILVLFAGVIALTTLAGFLATPFLDPGL
ncbi:hypothetical protein ACIP6P_21935 [Streptomyces sp. NPDC088729]|uniref:hypothetical protein n=1 Tax=Streptomyces sp. NPDC088729 TaxID=3365876 RepID=UPI003807ACFE